ncbi:MAG: hypothetical protein KF703_06390 [Actinobacteria bacterium]|nr:hypothetical protein [Actinomycetota bacterium]
MRCVIEHPDDDAASGHHWYEERITLWRARSIDEAIRRAQAEASTYAAELGNRDLGLAQAFRLADSAVAGAEVFSLVRGSHLEPGEYLDRFFDTGTEAQQVDPS